MSKNLENNKTDIYGISPHLNRAKELLNSGDEHKLKYACLELRFCFEIIAFRQLKQYGDVIPASLVKEWKADKIIKLLASFDPTSDQSGKLEIGDGNNPDKIPDNWHPLCSIESIEWRNFRKYYNKLGSYLHASKSTKPATTNKSSFDTILQELERVEISKGIVAIKNVRYTDCPECGNRIFIGDSEFEGDDIISCGNTKCNALFHKTVAADGSKNLTTVSVIVFKCKCEARIPVPLEAIWKPFSCPNCFNNYKTNLGYSQITLL